MEDLGVNRSLYVTKNGLFKLLQTIKTVAESQDSCRQSRQMQTVRTVTDCQDNCRPRLTVSTSTTIYFFLVTPEKKFLSTKI